MRFLFSIEPSVLQSERARIDETVARVLPGARWRIDARAGVLTVETPNGDMSAGEALRLALLAVGVHAVPMMQAPQTPPPIYMEKKRGRTVSLPVFIVSLVAVALVVSLLVFFVSSALFGAFGNDTLGNTNPNQEDYADKIALIDQFFKEYSIYDADGTLLLDEMLKAYAAATGDPYAAYYTAEEYAAMIAENNADHVGVGITVVYDAATNTIQVVSVLPDSPALAAGVLPGDRIVAIGTGDARVLVSEVGYDVAVDALLGEEGTVAEFEVLRGEQTIPFAITRQRVTTVSVTGKTAESDPTVGVVRITGFDTKTPVQFAAEMERLIGMGCVRFVFDVRNNPGGDLRSIQAVLSYFLNENDTVLSTVYKDGTTTVYRNVEAAYTDGYADCSIKKENLGKYRNYPITVLTNGATASAAELFTAALRDHGLAGVVGETTFGKGVLQSIYSLESYGYSGAIKLTVGYYNPPSGVNYDGVGIVPDTTVKLGDEAAKKHLFLLTEAEDAQLQKAIEKVKQ
ncbi:MAG: hypothetical protein IJA78_05795 [Clostridia bacterium]|nr:hypothetical protein [Clostridia bacterium]